MPPKTKFSDQEKSLYEYFKSKLVERDINKFPRDWHLKQLSVARNMLAGDNAPSLEDWQNCIDWCFKHPYWKDKVDHLARVEALWPKFCLQGGRKARKENDKYRLLYMS